MSVKILCDSSADLSIEEIREMDLLYVPIPVIFGEDTYLEGTNIDKEKFYEMLSNNSDFPTTSQPSPACFLDFFKEAKENGDEIVAILIPESLSGTLQNANLAKTMSDYDNIHIVDGYTLAAALRILIETAVKLRDEGKSAVQIVDALKNLRQRTKVYAALDTLENLYKGGRLTRAAAGIGEFANLKPVVTLDDTGKVTIAHKAIGKNKAISHILKHFCELNIDNTYPVYFIYSNLTENMEMLRSKMIAAHIDVRNNKACNLGPVLGTHVGMGAFGIAYVVRE